MSQLPHLALAASILFASACERSEKDRSLVTAHTDTYALKEAALSYMIRKFAPHDGYRLAITDAEHSERLFAALSATTTKLSAPDQSYLENEIHFDSATGLPVVFLSAEIKSIGPWRATVETTMDGGMEGGNWYSVCLRKSGTEWKVESVKLVATS